jgi:acetyl-CoA carboxylase/biotin carboxylase 1
VALACDAQVAVAFAEMHDTPVRMVAKGVLHGIVPWAKARPFLATRLRRRCRAAPPPSPSLVVDSPEKLRREALAMLQARPPARLI